MNKYHKYKNLYLHSKQMFGGADPNPNAIIGQVNDRSIFHLLATSDYGASVASVAHIYWSDDFTPFTLSHGKLIAKAIDSLTKSNRLISTINVYLIPKFNSKPNTGIKWSDQMNLIKLTAKELGKTYKSTINFYPSDFSRTVNSSIYLYENFASKPDLYLELELFCKLNAINPAQVYMITKPDEIVRIFTGIDQTNTIHLISKYNFITWNRTTPYIDLEVVNPHISTNGQMDLAFLLTIPVTTELLGLIFDQNVLNFKSRISQLANDSEIKYDNKRLDFFYGNEVKLNGELDYKTMKLSIQDINPKINKLVLFVFEEDLDLNSSMVKNGIKFISQSIYPSLLNYIGTKGLYF